MPHVPAQILTGQPVLFEAEAEIEQIANKAAEKIFSKKAQSTDAMGKKNRTKNYVKVVEGIGKLKAKYPKVATLYEVTVVSPGKEEKKNHACDIQFREKGCV